MEIRPIDMQLVINKATDVNKVNDTLHRDMENQQLFADHFAKEAQHENQSTVSSQRGEGENISDGGGNKNKDMYRRRKKRKSVKEEEKEKKKIDTSIFDVSV